MAVDLPGEVKDDLARVAEALSGSVEGARWVSRDAFHVTLSFLGQVADERIPGIAGAVAAAAASVPALEARVGALGAFPSPRRARVLWAGLEDPSGGFAALAEGVIAALEPVGFAREKRPYHAHVTLARLRVPRPVPLPAGVAPEPLPVPVRAVTLFQSHLRREGARYEPRDAFPLA